MITIIDSCDGQPLKHFTEGENLYYVFLSKPDGTPGLVTTNCDPPIGTLWMQIRKIDFKNGDLYERITNPTPLVNLFHWIAMLNGYPDVSRENGILLGMALIKSKQKLIYPNILKSKHFGKWKYRNKKLKITWTK